MLPATCRRSRRQRASRIRPTCPGSRPGREQRHCIAGNWRTGSTSASEPQVPVFSVDTPLKAVGLTKLYKSRVL